MPDTRVENIDLTSDLVFEGARTALINTRQKRYNNVKFSSELSEDGHFILKSDSGSMEIDSFDEAVLYIILSFRFCPLWLVRQWYSTRDRIVTASSGSSKIREMLDMGLVYEFPSAVAVFLMPTERLAGLFGSKLGGFNNPPYNTLTHTISEQQVMFECLTGQADYISDVTCIPHISFLGLSAIGSECIPELEYSVTNKSFKREIEKYNDQEYHLFEQMTDGSDNPITDVDFRERSLVIHKKVDQYDYDIKIPDLAVLAPREIRDGIKYPKSIALEVELTRKGVESYKKILDIYWDNLKFGRVVYLVNDRKTAEQLSKAYSYVREKNMDDDCQTCELKIVEFQVPYNHEQLESI